MATDRFLYAKIGVGIYSHPKAYLVGAEGVGVYVASLCYCVEHLTDGLIPRAFARTILEGDGAKQLDLRYKSPNGRLPLIHPDVGWWIDRGNFIEVWNYAAKNFTRAQVDEIRRQTRERVQRHRSSKLTSIIRSPSPVTELVTESVTNAVTSNDVTNASVPGSGSGSDLKISDQDKEQAPSQRMGDALVMPMVISPTRVPQHLGYIAPSPDPANFQSDVTPREQEYQAAYERGITAGKGSPFAMPENARGALHQALTKHARTAGGRVFRGDELLAWIAHEAEQFARFVASKPDEIKFYSGFGPKGWLRWLNEQPAETASGGMDDYGAQNAPARRLAAGIGNGGVRS